MAEKIKIIRTKVAAAAAPGGAPGAGPGAGAAREVIRYIGPINEDTGVVLGSLVTDADPVVVFNFRDVNYVNSNGIRNWIVFLREFVQGRQVSFEECSPTVVTQLNMIPSFSAGATIRSVLAPFTCLQCRTVSLVRFDGPNFPVSNDEVKPGRCGKCMGQTVLADNAVEYFDFAAQQLG